MRYTLKHKLITISAILLILPMLTVGTLSYLRAKEELATKGETTLKNAVSQAMMMIDLQKEAVARGEISASEAKERVKEMLLGPMQEDGTRPITGAIDLGANGYFVVYSPEGEEVLHPTLEGENVWDVEDKSGRGVKLVQEQIRAATEGNGFFSYDWTLPNSEEIGTKISYQEYDPDWRWIVSVGAYERDFDAAADKIFQTMLLVLAAASVIGIILILLFSRHLTSPITTISKALSSVAEGDLTVAEIENHRRDETADLAESFNKMLISLREIIGTTKRSAETVTGFATSLEDITTETTRAIQDVVATIQEVAGAVAEEAGSAEVVSGKMNDLSKSIATISTSADAMNDAVAKTQVENDRGLEAMGTLSSSSEETVQATREIGGVITRVNEASEKIHTITETITGISDQTNLLALNASIEAARAGEAGRGFAVVAEEIRKLAEASSRAVGEIKTIIDEINEQASLSAEKMTVLDTVIDRQGRIVGDTERQFRSISEAVRVLTSGIESLHAETKKIDAMRTDIMESVLNISASTEETSASTEEVSASSEEQLAGMTEINDQMHRLADVAGELKRIIGRFKI